MPIIFFHTIEISNDLKGPRSIEEKILARLSAKDPRPLCATIANIAPNQPKVNIYAHEDDANISIAFNADVKFHGGWSSSRIYTNKYGGWEQAADRPYHEVVDDIRKFHIADEEGDNIYREKYTIAAALRKNEETAKLRKANEPERYFSNKGNKDLSRPNAERHLDQERSGLSANEYHVEARIYNVRCVALTSQQNSSPDAAIILQLKARELLEQLQQERLRVLADPAEIAKLVHFEQSKRETILAKIRFFREKILSYQQDLEHVKEPGGEGGYQYNPDLIYAFAHKRMKFRSPEEDDKFAAFGDNEFAQRNRETWLKHNIAKLYSSTEELVDELAVLPVDPAEIEQQIRGKLAEEIRAEIYDRDSTALLPLELKSRDEYIEELKRMAVVRENLFFTLVKANISIASIKAIIFENELLSPQQKMQQFLFHMPSKMRFDSGFDIFSLPLSREILSEMVSCGFDINAKIKHKEKEVEPLLLAVLRENKVATQTLLELGAQMPQAIQDYERSFIEKVRTGEDESDKSKEVELEKSAYLSEAESEEEVDEEMEGEEMEGEEMEGEELEESEEESEESEEELEESEEEMEGQEEEQEEEKVNKKNPGKRTQPTGVASLNSISSRKRRR